jgi:catechol 2,3-dioxygenase-like lactoylglutathione lyase family enzyme
MLRFPVPDSRFPMFTSIDHLMITVPDLERGAEQYRKLGFNVQPGGTHPGKGTHNAIAFTDEDYLELLAIRDKAEQQKAGGWHADLDRFIAAGGGIRFVILQSDDLAADVAAMKQRGVDVSDAFDGRRAQGGVEFRWKAATLGPKNPLPLFFIQHLTPMAERRKHTPGAGPHPNGVRFLERVYIVVQDLEASVALYAKVLGADPPRMYKGTVIMSHMAVFQYGNTGLTVAHPYAIGPASQALESRGPGPFQALYRTTSMGAAARWMEKNGMPPPAIGTRDTGEKAMLVSPTDACGAYIGFVGPE